MAATTTKPARTTPADEGAIDGLAADYFKAVEAVKEIHNEAERKIAALKEREETRAREALAEADLLICTMLDLGMSKAEVSERLGVANRHIRRAMDTHRANRRLVDETPEAEKASATAATKASTAE